MLAEALDALKPKPGFDVLVMSEEKASNYETQPGGQELKRIIDIGTDPWLVRELRGTVAFKRPDAARLKVFALDFNGYPLGTAGTANAITLQRTTVYYLVTK